MPKLPSLHQILICTLFGLSPLAYGQSDPSLLEIRNRQEVILQSYQIINDALIQADQNPKLQEYLNHIHFSREHFDQLKTAGASRVKPPLDEFEIKYRFVDSAHCAHGKFDPDAGTSQVIAFFDPKTKVVNFCDIYFDNDFFGVNTSIYRAETLLHEQIHSLGLVNECDTESAAFAIFFAGNKKVPPAYLWMCPALKAYSAELFRAKDAQSEEILYENPDLTATKVAYVNIARVINAMAEGREAQKQVENFNDSKKANLTITLGVERNELLSDYSARSPSMTEKEKTEARAKLTALDQKIESANRTIEIEVQAFRKKTMAPLLEKIRRTLPILAIKNRYKKIKNTDKPASQDDLTDQVITEYRLKQS